MLLFIIFIGLLCLRLHERRLRSAFRVGLGRLLWGQVGYGRPGVPISAT